MEFYVVEGLGYAAAAASLYATYSKTIVPLRIAAIVANTLAIVYCIGKGTYPSLILNAVLLPLNTFRLRSMFKLVRDVETATKGDLNVEWLRGYMRPKSFKAGDFVVMRGDIAADAFYIVSGEVELPEIGKTVGPGTLLGEIGLFAPGNRRMTSARAKTDVSAATITYDEFKELYFQNPQFGFFLLRLIVARLQDNVELPQHPTMP